jgi:O-methyltransferase
MAAYGRRKELKSRLKVAAKLALARLIYRYPPFGLQPERLAIYLNGLLRRRELGGDVAEIGCSVGGTAAIAARMLRRVGWKHRYICYDTFGGFVAEQFDRDVARGTEERRRGGFSANSMVLVRKILTLHGAAEVELVQGDIARISDCELSDSYSVVLIDVDLAEPIYVALRRFWPRVVNGGVIFVDDCEEGDAWKARVGYERFCAEAGIRTRYEFGFGVVEK